MSPEVAVIATVNLFHLGVHRRDWMGASSCLADVVRFSPDGTDGGLTMPADQFLATIRSNAESFAATQHFVAGHHVRLVSADTARCRANFQYHHVTGSDRWVLAGHQELHLHRMQDTWQIAAVKLSPAWEDGANASAVDSRKTSTESQRPGARGQQPIVDRRSAIAGG